MNDFEILDLEYILPNKKSIDCLLLNTKRHQSNYIDFYSIHINSGKVEDVKKFSDFLAKRVVDKFAKKVSNIKDIEMVNQIRILPVLWSDLEMLKRYQHVFVESVSLINEEFFTLYSIENSENNECIFIFKPVSVI